MLRQPGETVQFVHTFPSFPDRKARLHVPDGELPLPRFRPLDSRYPLTLISPATAKTINSMFAEFAPPPAVLSIHPDDAAPRGLIDNATVRVWNDQASIELPCSLDTYAAPRRVRHAEGVVAPQPPGRADGERVRAGHDLRPRRGRVLQ